MSDETVKIDISIQISNWDVVDTGLTVEQWNALTDKERSAIHMDNWQAMASSDDGGSAVITPGAKEV